MNVINGHASDLTVAKQRTVDRTEALEHIVQVFDEGQKTKEKSLMSRVKRRFLPVHEDGKVQMDLASYQKDLEHEQLLEARC